MAQPNTDCARINELIVEINNTNREIPKIIREMEHLGFGTVKTARLIKSIYKFATVLDKIPAVVWEVLYKFVRCDNAALAQLAVAELKLLVEVLDAYADVQLEALEDADRRRDLEGWRKTIAAELNGWADTRGKADAVAAVTALKQGLVKATPWILEGLVEAFGDDIREAVKQGLDNRIKKTLYKAIVNRIVAFAVGKAVAQRVNPFVGVALTGWELLVEIAGTGAVDDLRAYVDRLLVQLVVLLERCKWGWPQRGDGFFIKGQRYRGATVMARAFVRCATVANGKPHWSAPCALLFDTGHAVISLTMTDQNINQQTGQWEQKAVIDPAALQNSPCLKGAKYCYTYLELTIVFPDRTRTVLTMIVGAKTF